MLNVRFWAITLFALLTIFGTSIVSPKVSFSLTKQGQYSRDRISTHFLIAQESSPEASPSPEVSPSPESSKAILEVEGALEEGDAILPTDGSLYDEYSFEATENQEITITLESLDFDTYLAIFTPENKLLKEHDDISQENSNSELKINLPMAGTYRIIVNSYDNTGRGKYSLKVR